MIQGARITGAGEIIAIDMNETKLQMAKEFGATATVNAGEGDPVAPGDGHDRPARRRRRLRGDRPPADDRPDDQHDPSRRPGHPRRRAPDGRHGHASRRSSGSCSSEKTIKGCWYGSSNVQKDVPKLVELYKKGELKLDELISRTIKLDEVNEAFEAMKTGEVARSVITYE